MWREIVFRTITDSRGNLTPVENGLDIPFDLERVYYLYDVPSGSHRAGHAHKSLHQIYLAISGSFDVHLDDGSRRKTVTLSRPSRGIYIYPGVWRDIDNFSAGSVCLVLASAKFDEADYIRDYEDFRRYVEQQPSSAIRVNSATQLNNE